MKLSSKVQALTDLVTPAVNACGVKLWGIEFRPQGKRSLLRIYIDLPSDNEEANANKKSVSVDECKMVSHQVSGLLDVHDPIAGEYVLEVSSPGWDRQFFNIEQLKEYLDKTISLRLIQAVNNRRKYEAKLIEVSENTVTIEFLEKNSKQSPEAIEIHISNIDKASLVYED